MSFEQAQSITSQIEIRTESDHEESAAIARAVEGDASAIDWLINRYRARVVRLAMHILRQSGEAEDAAQEAFIRAFRNLDRYNQDGKFFTWLYRIVVRVCLDRRRLSRWSAEVELASLPNSGIHADSAFEDVDLKIVVDRLLDELSPQMRAMLVLREMEGLEYSEIAEALQIPIGRVRWRLHTARRKFQALWESAQQETKNVS
jgi:RNA polymerase sigma-70 factor (ECF subfamily)